VISYSGERPPQSQHLSQGKKLPPWLAPYGGGCVIRPESTVVVWKNGQRYVHVVPGMVSCIDPENHDHSDSEVDDGSLPEFDQ
jgi:hypothetical protein